MGPAGLVSLRTADLVGMRQTLAMSPEPVTEGALPAHERPTDPTPVHTEQLPPTPIRDRNIPASAWVEAPPELLDAGADIGSPEITYKRRIHDWLLWRAGPATKADSRYVAIDSADLERFYSFRLFPNGRGEGIGPSGRTHERFRTWKEDLRDHG